MVTSKITSSLHEPRVQISLDLTSIDEALHRRRRRLSGSLVKVRRNFGSVGAC